MTSISDQGPASTGPDHSADEQDWTPPGGEAWLDPYGPSDEELAELDKAVVAWQAQRAQDADTQDDDAGAAGVDATEAQA